MDNQEQLNEVEEKQLPQLIVTEDMRSYIYDIAKWGRLLGIVGFSLSAFLFLAALTIGPAMNNNPEVAKMVGQLGNIDGSTFSMVLVFYALIFSYPSFLITRYAAKAKQGVLYGDQESLDEGMAKLKSLFKYFGILALIVMGLYIITIFSGLFGK